MRTLNLRSLAHVDPRQTSLTGRPLAAAGVIAGIGSFDAGSSRTDPLALDLLATRQGGQRPDAR
ncbi:MAG: hypothetical protein M3464_21425 [Chloroflexota bacterium]|nr:hypothetical protein [Chloroflexota bacterium]